MDQDDTNWRLVAWHGQEGHEVIASGESEAVGGLGELVDVTLSHVGRTFSVAVGDTVVFTGRSHGDGGRYSVSYVALGAWPADYGSTVTKTGVFGTHLYVVSAINNVGTGPPSNVIEITLEDVSSMRQWSIPRR